jgi:hypothetical protein
MHGPGQGPGTPAQCDSINHSIDATSMGDFAQVSDAELLLRPGNPAFWEA